MATNNAINQHRPSGFEVYLTASTANDVTGDNTQYTIVCDGVIGTDGNYNTGTGIYTVTQSGVYAITSNIVFQNITNQTSCYVLVYNTAANYFYPWDCAMDTLDNAGTLALPSVVTISMAAGTTMYVAVAGLAGAKTVGITGGNAPYKTQVSCFLIGYV